MNRILVIRGGAIGDFILTLPALKALREANAGAHIEILGYTHITELAHNRYYANAVRSIEYGPLSRFFAKGSELSTELAAYFGAFDLAISYLYDPDSIFEDNLLRCGLRTVARGPGKIGNHKHAAAQLAEPIANLGVKVADLAPRLFPSAEDRQFASTFLRDCAQPLVALHPGSGGEKKNWPLENWIELGNDLLRSEDFGGSLLVVGGEADEMKTRRLKSIWSGLRVLFAENLPLPHLAAVLESTVFLGHDSGVSHLAAAAGADCILLFGPTDPAVWAPSGEKIRIVSAPGGNLDTLKVETVQNALGDFRH